MSGTKKFFRVWNPEIYEVGEEIYDFCGIEAFTEQEGYDEEDIKSIKELGLSESWVNENFGHNSHTVIRVK